MVLTLDARNCALKLKGSDVDSLHAPGCNGTQGHHYQVCRAYITEAFMVHKQLLLYTPQTAFLLHLIQRT